MKNVRAKRHLGQHFLNDQNIAKNITNLLSKDTNFIVEIGPGMGILTQFLIQKKINIELVEIDSESVCYLNKNYPKLKGRIKEKDFLKLNIKEIYPKYFWFSKYKS